MEEQYKQKRKIKQRRREKTKKRRSGDPRPWKDLGRDVLISIFQRLDLNDLIKGVSLCCPSWYAISKDPSVWKEVDLSSFKSNPTKKSVLSSQLVQFVVNRSQGSLTSISFSSDASVDDLLVVAERCPRLKYFELRVNAEKVVEGKKATGKAIGKLKELEGMAVEDIFISDDSTLEQISQCCPNFIKLKVYNALSKNTTALVAKFLPKLKILDVSQTKIHRLDLLVILKGCQELEKVDLTGCGKVYGSDEILTIGCTRIKEFGWDDEVIDSCSECEEELKNEYGSDYEGTSYQWPCEHVQDQGFYSGTYIEGTEDLVDNMIDDVPISTLEKYDFWDCLVASRTLDIRGKVLLVKMVFGYR